LFIGGLSWETTIDGLQRYFSRFGEVVDSVVMKNPDTGRSRGFGFVTFSDPANVDAVLNSGPHQLDGRTVSCIAFIYQIIKSKFRSTDHALLLPKRFATLSHTYFYDFRLTQSHAIHELYKNQDEVRTSRRFSWVDFLQT